MGDLSKLHIVVLRAPRDADLLVDTLSSAGARIHLLPVQKIISLSEDSHEIGQQIEQIQSFDKAIFVSARATQYALEWLERSDPTAKIGPAAKISAKCFAIGPASAHLLEKRKFAVTVPSHGSNSEALLALSALRAVNGQKIIVFRGKGGRTILGDTLESRGASVEYCELYQRQIDERFKDQIFELLASGKPVLLLAHSGEIVDALLTITERQNLDIIFSAPIVVPGTRVQRYAGESGFKTVVAAASAIAEDMEAAVRGWYTQTM
jgi:uroporphyrinogen-III synthase